MKNKREVLVKLFLSTLYLSAFTFGGGYVIVTLMKKKFVDDYHWIEENEMLDLVAIAQSAPGPIAVNGAIVVGYKLAGLAGTLVAIIGTIIPPFVIISLISAFYHAFRDNYLVSQMLEGMQAGVGAVIASVTYEMGCGIIKKKDNVATIVMIAAFIAACVLGINVIYIVIASGVFGVIRTIWNRRRTSLLQKKLGADHRVIEEGLCGRTTVFQDDLREGRRGLDLIGVTMEMHNPIDLLIVMLGTNDCKTRYNASAGTIAKGLAQVIQKARKNASQPFDLLVISPIHLGEGVGDPGFDPEFDEKSVEVSKKLAEEYHKVALLHHAAFLDASAFASPSTTDREHLDAAGHAALANAIYEKVIDMQKELEKAV